MSTASLLPQARFVAYDPNGAPLAGGFVYTYVPGGTVPKLTWQDAAETIPNENPITLDAVGSCLLYGSGTYQITVTDSLGNQVPAYSGLTEDAASLAGISSAMTPVVSAPSLTAGITALFAGSVMQSFVLSTTLQAARAALTLTPNTVATHAPTTYGNDGSITTAFTGDLSQVGWAFPYTITGTATLGEPATGYMYTPELSMYYDYFLNKSGWNQSTTGNVGRTAATCHFTRVDQQGQGDCMGYVVIGTVSSTKPGATSWLASPAISAYDADMQAGAAHVYLNPVEINCSDNGFDCAAICFVGNLNRTVNTAALGEPWIGARLDSFGTAAADAAISVSGPFTIGMDLTTATLGTQKAGVTLAATQRLYFGATNATGFPAGTNPTGPYITYDGNNLVLDGTSGGAIEIDASAALVTVVGELLVSGGPCLPLQDNTWTLGGSSNRWSQVFAGIGTINTSDENEKQDISGIPAALLDAWDTVSPRMYKMRASVATKGPEARTHTGYVAQEFAAALLQQRLIPAEWGGWCNDVLKTGGERQGLRYDELFTIADAAHRRRFDRLETRLAALEASR